MPEVSQDQIDGMSGTLDKILKVAMDMKKQLTELRQSHDSMAFKLRRKGPINRK